MLLLEEIQFLFQGFLFLAMSKFSCIRFHLFVAWNVYTVVPPHTPFCLSANFCSVDACVVCILSGGSNQSSSALFYVVFCSLYRCFDSIWKTGWSSSSFSWYIQFVYGISGIIIVVIIINSLEFFTSALADGLSLEFEWQEVSSTLLDSSHYSGRSQ